MGNKEGLDVWSLEKLTLQNLIGLVDKDMQDEGKSIKVLISEREHSFTLAFDSESVSALVR